MGIEVHPVHCDLDGFPWAHHLPVILPISGAKSSFITPGIPFLVEPFDDIMLSSRRWSAVRVDVEPGSSPQLAWPCWGEVGAVPCFDASQLTRNGRDWSTRTVYMIRIDRMIVCGLA
jgi:hypothetical protein